MCSKTDTGPVRSENQDREAYSVISADCAWAVVCDGMGGVNGGKLASTIAVEHISEVLEREYRELMSEDELGDLLIKAVEQANAVIYQTSRRRREYYGMGTTCELVFIRSGSAFIAHVGDSRTYSIRDGMILQLTEDHSLVQQMVNMGELTPEEAAVHPKKNIITRALGVCPDVDIDYIEAEFAEGDTILICTDGLSNFVSKDDIAVSVSAEKGDLLVDTLVEMAKKNGGSDNITVTVMY